MSAQTGIEWTDATWNPIVGCSIVSPGCTNCYAMRQAHRLASNPQTPHYAGTTKVVNGKPVWTGRLALAPDSVFQAPLRWKKPRRIFVNSMGDLFHDDVPDAWIDRALAVMVRARRHTFQILTKHPERARRYFLPRVPGGARQRVSKLVAHVADAADLVTVRGVPWLQLQAFPGPNVWIGTSVERPEFMLRVKWLLGCNGTFAGHFLSCEPLLAPLDLGAKLGPVDGLESACDAFSGRCEAANDIWPHPRIGWVIAGGESGPDARPMHPDWVRGIRDQCAAAGVPFHFKQWGAWSIVYDRDRDDPDWRRCPKARDHSERYVNIVGGHGFHGERVCFARRVGKKAAGRELDGRTHDAYPETAR